MPQPGRPPAAAADLPEYGTSGMRRKPENLPHTVRIADVAALAGVSTATVSRTLASPEKVSPETRTRVMRAVRKSGYTPNSSARTLRTRRTMMILVIVPNIANPFFAEVLRGIDAELSEHGYGLIIGNLDNTTEKEMRYVDLALSRQVDGVLLLNGWIPGTRERMINRDGMPVVGLCAAIPVSGVPNVVVQNRTAGRQAVTRLASLGHRRFGYISGPAGNIIETERFAGFNEGIVEAEISRRDVVRWEGQFTFACGVTAAEDFLAIDKNRPTAVFAVNDEMAIGFLKTVQAAGVRSPDDVSVIGFDGIEFAEFSEPTLTTFRQPRHQLGRTGAGVLVKLIVGAMLPEDWDVELPVPLLERQSTGPAPRT